MANKKIFPGMDNLMTEPQEKHQYSIWWFDASHVYADCIACGQTAFCEPSEYCPHCGAVMLNVIDARRVYHKDAIADEDEKTEEDHND